MKSPRPLVLIGLALTCLACPARREEPKPEAGKPKESTDLKLAEGGAGTERARDERRLVGEVAPLDHANIPWGGTVNFRESSDPQSLNPVSSNDGNASRLFRALMIYPQLTRVHLDDSVLYPFMAESLPELSDDKLTYTWHLRKGVKWLHSGREVTSADYLAAWKKLQDPEVDAAPRRAVFDRYSDLVVVNDHTFQVKMKEPYFAGVWNFGYHFFPIPHEVFDGMSGKDFNEHPIRREPMGFGLFRFERATRAVELVFKRDDTNAAILGAANIDCNLRVPHVDRVRMVIVKDSVAAFEMLRAGEIDVLAMSADDWQLKTQDPEFDKLFHKAEYYLPQFLFLAWNMRKPMFADVRVRKALTMLTRRQEIVDSVRYGHATVINGPGFIFSRAYDDSFEPLPFDPVEASRLVAEAGWKDTDGDGWLDKDGQRFTFELIHPSGKNPDSEALMLLLAEDAKKIGIDMQQRPLEWTTFIETLYDRKFDGAFLSFLPDPTYEDQYEAWHSSQADIPRSANHAGYSNPEVDRLVEAARVEFDDAKRYDMLRQVHRIVGQDVPFTWLWCGESLVAVNKRWNNVQVHKLGVRYVEWSLAEGGRSTPAIPD